MEAEGPALGRDEQAVIQLARQSLAVTIERLSPPDSKQDGARGDHDLWTLRRSDQRAVDGARQRRGRERAACRRGYQLIETPRN
jgi:hypothetical protein